MRENTKLAAEIGYLPIPNAFMGKEEDIKRLPPNKVCIIAPGSQGQYNSAMYKMALKQNKKIVIQPGDKIIFSSDPIPGNENEVYSLIEELSLQGAEVVYTAIQDDLHASGHGSREDMKFLMRFTNPKYLIPIGSTIRHQRQYQKLAGQLGFAKENVFMLAEGDTVWFTKNKAEPGQTVETRSIYVDAYGVGDIGSIVLRDRQTLSSDGMVVAIIIADAYGKLVSRPKVLSKGFVFEEGQDELFEEAVKLIEKQLKPHGERMADFSSLKKNVGSILEEYFFKEKGRKPLVVVDVVQI